MHRQYRTHCGRHGDGAALQRSGKPCSVCHWDGWTVYDVIQGHKTAGYNGRSVASRRRAVKSAGSGRIMGTSVGEYTRRISGDTGTLAVNNLSRQATSVAAILERLGY